ncbi:MAG: rod shape-determining protein MreD [Ardenticatenaceae bacterium]|nr:rod shape-determining protein MreD [Anaerolineales bacterium]MCB9009069.1 rod shape-determining protein MreD [Ardenticatenaceae bacterium]
MTVSIYLAIPLMLVLGLVQTAVLPHFPIFGTTPQLTFLVALAWGLLYGVEEGAVWAFFAGIFTDLFSITPMGVSSLAFMVGITAVIWATQALPASRVLLPLALAGLATIISFIIELVLLRLFGTITDFQSIMVLPNLLLVHVLATLPIYWLLYIAKQVTQPRRVRL